MRRVHIIVCLFSFCLPAFGKSSWVSNHGARDIQSQVLCEHLQSGGHNAGGRISRGRLVLNTLPGSRFSALVTMYFTSTQKSLICHHALKVFVRNWCFGAVILLLMLISLVMPASDKRCFFQALLVSSSPLSCSAALPWSTFSEILGSYWSHNKRQQQIKHGLWGGGIHWELGCRCCEGTLLPWKGERRHNWRRGPECSCPCPTQ